MFSNTEFVAYGLLAVSGGAISGFSNSKGIQIEPSALEKAMLLGPAAVNGLAGTIRGSAAGSCLSGQYVDSCSGFSVNPQKIAKGAVLGGSLGLAVGSILGLAMTAVGYGAGYTAGKLT